MIQPDQIEQYRENNRIEAKKALGGLPKSIWETYSAFANTLGGVILLGVEEYKDKSFHTVDLPDPQKLVDEFLAILNNKEKVSVNILTNKDIRIETVQGHRIIMIEVPRARRHEKPVYVDGSLYSGTYRRNGEGDYHCTKAEIEAMRRDAAVHSADAEVFPLLDLSAFDHDTINAYRKRYSLARNPDETMSVLSFLQEINAVDEEGHPTMGGLLMFGQEDILLREIPSYSVCLDGHPLKMNVFTFYSHVIAHLRTVLDTEEGSAIDKVLKEALANCVTNADYQIGIPIRVQTTEKQVIMTNPGGFRIPVAHAKSGGLSDPRNSGMMRMFNLIQIGEHTGSGIPSIFHAWRSEGFHEPSILQTFQPEETKLVLPLTEDDANTTTSASPEEIYELIVSYLTDRREASRREIAEYLHLSETQAKKYLTSMIRQQLVVNADRLYRLKA
ncbi:MAG: putative DNA binding domain-containing protein [Solobacterium sp.]|nr:putative DNA binding domain-containing protein [Solobacterium sp.]